MNIFILDRNPAEAVKGLIDTHVRKMLLESLQLLHTHYRLLNGKQITPKGYIKPDGTVKTYKNTQKFWQLPTERVNSLGYVIVDPAIMVASHVNHPCRVWLGEDGGANVSWLVHYTFNLYSEYVKRFGTSPHYDDYVGNLTKLIDVSCFKLEVPFKFAIAINKELYPDVDQTQDVVQVYRDYYNTKLNQWRNGTKRQQNQVKWTPVSDNAIIPEWVEV